MENRCITYETRARSTSLILESIFIPEAILMNICHHEYFLSLNRILELNVLVHLVINAVSVLNV